MDNEAPAEGWFRDPYGTHEQRWMSQGQPTSLVRDGVTEAEDGPPNMPAPGPLVPVPGDDRGDSAHLDTRRADDTDNQPIPDAGYYGDVAMDASVVFDGLGPAPSGLTWETSFDHKMRKAAKKKERAERTRRWFGQGR